METTLYAKDRIRLSTGSSNGVFINVECLHYDCLSVDHYGMHYMELREKGGNFRMFSWAKKSLKKDHDFGYWEDSICVWSFNRNGKDSQILHG